MLQRYSQLLLQQRQAHGTLDLFLDRRKLCYSRPLTHLAAAAKEAAILVVMETEIAVRVAFEGRHVTLQTKTDRRLSALLSSVADRLQKPWRVLRLVCRGRDLQTRCHALVGKTLSHNSTIFASVQRQPNYITVRSDNRSFPLPTRPQHQALLQAQLARTQLPFGYVTFLKWRFPHLWATSAPRSNSERKALKHKPTKQMLALKTCNMTLDNSVLKHAKETRCELRNTAANRCQ